MNLNENLNEINLEKCSGEDFFNFIESQKGISRIWLSVLKMLKSLEPKMGLDSEKIFIIYFSLLDDGNTCICLDKKVLFEKWQAKWKGLLLVSGDFSKEEEEAQLKAFETVIASGTKKLGSETSVLLGSDKDLTKPFVIQEIEGKNWLFSTKYFAAKNGIEQRVKILFPETHIDYEKIKPEAEKITKEFLEKTDFELKDRQPYAVALGQKQNLIITGGPGSGKTTAICFLLWKLLSSQDSDGTYYYEYNLYMAAPSGKAAERIKESISSSLKRFKPANEVEKEVEKKLTQTDSSTIHRLLNYNPMLNVFNNSEENQFEEKSIFIIDETSMIDIVIFKNLLEAIPDKAKVFLLGDKDQLPSVQAGAVLGELLGKVKGSVITLEHSQRFNENSPVGRLKKEIQNPAPFNEDMSDFGKWIKSCKELEFTDRIKNEYPVVFYDLYKEVEDSKKSENPEETPLTLGKAVIAVAKKWAEKFCFSVADSAFGLDKNGDIAVLDKLWQESLKAKILCAENNGKAGIKNINNIISRYVCREKNIEIDDSGHFAGELLIVTKNQRIFNLYNGDCGVAVSFGNSPVKYLMVEKKQVALENKDGSSQEIFRIGNYLFYPLYLLPSDSIDTAFAITIHKSQGSGYEQIMVILPQNEGHPLLNRQIFYTAITRTEGNTYIIASRAAMNYAKQVLIQRDTKIMLD